MIRLIRMTFFNGCTKQQMVDFMVGMILTMVLLTFMIVFINIFG
ncbi:MAG: hypothetical protein SOW57_03150 [Prevotella sp.]|nr:hypothetical protein [Prevotella sp.]